VAELAANHGTDLRHLLDRPEPIEAGQQRAVQGVGDGPRRQRAIKHVPPAFLAQEARFEHRPGELLDEQRHSVGLGLDLLQNFRRQRPAAGHVLHKRHDLARPEAVQAQKRGMGVAGPGRREFRAQSDDEQHRQALNSFHNLVEEL
jgi:hypothetical protein